jgi:hypothetical protein
MVKRCETDGCETRPTCNTQGETKGRFCAAHGEDGMVDVRNKRCETDGCEKLNPIRQSPSDTREPKKVQGLRIKPQYRIQWSWKRVQSFNEDCRADIQSRYARAN